VFWSSLDEGKLSFSERREAFRETIAMDGM